MARQKIQYPAVSKTLFVAAAITLPFSAFSQPLPTKPAAHLAQSVVNAPFTNTQTVAVFSQFSAPQLKTQTALSWLNTPIQLMQNYAVFAQFSQPQFNRGNLPNEQSSALFEIQPPPAPPFVGFASFSQPQFGKLPLPDEQPTSFFEVLTPPAPPFTGFARFGEYLVAKSKVYLYSAFLPTPIVIPVDTHDGGWVKKKRKEHPDLIERELEERRLRRKALELAIYGPEVTYEIKAPTFPTVPPAPVVTGLAHIIASAEHQKYISSVKQADDDEEDDLENILRDIL